MSEMIDKVALAIWKAREADLPERLKRCTPDNLDRATGAWAQAQMLARAAIGAMREATVSMSFVGQITIDGGCQFPSDDCWQAMIDEALRAPSPLSGRTEE